MHYFKRNIGDYHKKAGRLSMLEHGAYTLLLDSCYDREQFPTREQAIDWCWARTDDEVAAVEFVLSKFFILEDGVYVQTRIQEEVDRYHQNARTNKEIARKREAQRREERARNEHEPCTDEHEPAPNQEPLTTNQEPRNKTPTSKPSVSSCPYEDIINLYHEALPELQAVVVSRWRGSQREKTLRARWREDERHRDLDFWKWFFDVVRTNPHWMGDNDRGWRANLGWLLERRNFDKVIETGVSISNGRST